MNRINWVSFWIARANLVFMKLQLLGSNSLFPADPVVVEIKKGSPCAASVRSVVFSARWTAISLVLALKSATSLMNRKPRYRWPACLFLSASSPYTLLTVRRSPGSLLRETCSNKDLSIFWPYVIPCWYAPSACTYLCLDLRTDLQ